MSVGSSSSSSSYLALQLDVLVLDDVGVVGQPREGLAAHLELALLAVRLARVVAVVVLVRLALHAEQRAALLQRVAVLQPRHLLQGLVILLPITLTLG